MSGLRALNKRIAIFLTLLAFTTVYGVTLYPEHWMEILLFSSVFITAGLWMIYCIVTFMINPMRALTKIVGDMEDGAATRLPEEELVAAQLTPETKILYHALEQFQQRQESNSAEINSLNQGLERRIIERTEELQYAASSLTAMLEAARDVNTVLNEEAVIRKIAFSAVRITNSEKGMVGVVRKGKVEFREYFDGEVWSPVRLDCRPDSCSSGCYPVFKKETVMAATTTMDATTEDLSSPSEDLPPAYSSQFGFEIKSYLTAPIIDKDADVLGFVEVYNKDGGDTFTAQDRINLYIWANQSAATLQNARSYEKSIIEAERSAARRNILNAVASNLELENLTEELLEPIARLVKFDVIRLLKLDWAQSKCTELFGVVNGSPQIVRVSIPINETSILKLVLSERQTIMLEDLQKNVLNTGVLESELAESGIRSLLVAPINSKSRMIGILILGSHEKGIYKEQELFDGQIVASALALAMENTSLFETVSRAKKEWERTFDAIPDLITIHDLDHNIVRFNKAAQDKLGFTAEELNHKKCYELFHGTSSPIPGCPFASSVATGSVTNVEIDEEHLGGSFQILAAPLSERGDGHRVTGCVHLVRDVTREHKLQEQLIQTEKIGALGELVSGVAHELNNPLTSVLGYAQLIRMNSMEDGTLKDADRIIDESKRAAKIINNLLTFSRKQKPTYKLINLAEALHKTVELREYELRTRNITVNINVSGGPISVWGDFQMLQQVFLNLLNNAEYAISSNKASGSIHVTIAKEAGTENVIVTFSDDGGGINKQTIGKVFDPFFTTKDVGKGTGLGLSISHGIIQEHGGRIVVRNNDRGGATFTISFPSAQRFAMPEEITGIDAGSYLDPN